MEQKQIIHDQRFHKMLYCFPPSLHPTDFSQSVPLRAGNGKVYWLGDEFNSVLTRCIHTK